MAAAGAGLPGPWRALTYTSSKQRPASLPARYGARVSAGSSVSLLLLQDTIDFPIAFWGALRAGVVPVPINTLLTPETVAYILADSRVEGAIMSAGLVAGRAPARRRAEMRRDVAEPDGSDPVLTEPGWTSFQAFLARGDRATATADASPDEVAFWLYSSGSTGAPKGVRHVHSSLRVTAETYGAGCWKSVPMTSCFPPPRPFTRTGSATALPFLNRSAQRRYSCRIGRRPRRCWR